MSADWPRPRSTPPSWAPACSAARPSGSPSRTGLRCTGRLQAGWRAAARPPRHGVAGRHSGPLAEAVAHPDHPQLPRCLRHEGRGRAGPVRDGGARLPRGLRHAADHRRGDRLTRLPTADREGRRPCRGGSGAGSQRGRSAQDRPQGRQPVCGPGLGAGRARRPGTREGRERVPGAGRTGAHRRLVRLRRAHRHSHPRRHAAPRPTPSPPRPTSTSTPAPPPAPSRTPCTPGWPRCPRC